MNSITHLGPQVYEVGQIKDSIKIVKEPELNIVQFLITDMKSRYFQNKSSILSKPQFTDIDKKFLGDQSVLQVILKERQELDKKSILHFINKAERLAKQFHHQQYYSQILSDLKISAENIKAQKGQNLFQYQFDLLEENIDFAHEIYVSKSFYDQIEQDTIYVILDLLLYNIYLYISQFTTCDFTIQEKEKRILIQFPDNPDFLIEPLIKESSNPQANINVPEAQRQQHQQSQQQQQQQQEQLEQQQQQQQHSQEQILQQYRSNTERYSIESNISQSPKKHLLNNGQEKQSERNHQQEILQNSQQFSTNEQQQLYPTQQQIPQQLQPENIDEQDKNVNILGEALQKKQDQIYFKQPIFWDSKPRRKIFFNFTEPQDQQIIKLCSIFKDKSIFYSCDKLLLYNQHSFILKIEQFISTSIKCYSTVKIDDIQNFQDIKYQIINSQALKQIFQLKDDPIIYNIIVKDLKYTLIEQFNMELDQKIIECL